MRHFAWGTGIEFVYYVPARSGKKNRRDKVIEVVTTRGETLYRFAYWMRERDLKKVEAPLQKIVESFRPEAPVVASDANAVSDPASWAEHRYSLWGAELGIESYRKELSSGEGEGEGPAFAEAQAGLAETLGWKAYLMDGASPSELDEIRRAAAAAMSLAPEDADSQQARAWAAYHDNRLVENDTTSSSPGSRYRAREATPSNARSLRFGGRRACTPSGQPGSFQSPYLNRPVDRQAYGSCRPSNSRLPPRQTRLSNRPGGAALRYIPPSCERGTSSASRACTGCAWDTSWSNIPRPPP